MKSKQQKMFTENKASRFATNHSCISFEIVDEKHGVAA